MLIAKVEFPKIKHSLLLQEEYSEIIEEYLSSLSLNGQIWGEYKLGVSNGVLEGYVTIPERNSILQHYNSSYGNKAYDKIRYHSGIYPKWSFLTDEENLYWKNWRRSKFLFLRTNYLDISSPLAIPYKNCGIPIPIYLLPIKDEIREYISRWADAYRNHDKLWIGSGDLEILAYKQLTNINSDLSIKGRDICKIISDSTGIPTYFYQYRYFSYSNGEGDRKCPSCGRQWRQSTLKDKNFREFHFMCKRCHIVSHEGDSQDGDELARIGDFDESNIKLT